MSNAHIAIDVYGDGDASGGSRSSLADEQRRSQSHSGSAFDDDTSLMLLREEGTESALSALCTPPLAHMRRSGTLSSRARRRRAQPHRNAATAAVDDFHCIVQCRHHCFRLICGKVRY